MIHFFIFIYVLYNEIRINSLIKVFNGDMFN
jgi:hypothetical protein